MDDFFYSPFKKGEEYSVCFPGTLWFDPWGDLENWLTLLKGLKLQPQNISDISGFHFQVTYCFPNNIQQTSPEHICLFKLLPPPKKKGKKKKNIFRALKPFSQTLPSSPFPNHSPFFQRAKKPRSIGEFPTPAASCRLKTKAATESPKTVPSALASKGRTLGGFVRPTAVADGPGWGPRWRFLDTFGRVLGCPRKLGSMVRINGLWPTYKWGILGLKPIY